MSDALLPTDDCPSSVLLLTPGLANDSSDTCRRLLSIEEPATSNVLWVSYTDPPSDRAAEFQSHFGAPATSAGIMVGETAAGPAGEGLDSFQTVNAPADLTGLGIAVSEQLREWAQTGRQNVVCFDSLTALLQYVDIDTAYEFLHVITGRMYTFDAVGHFHIDPDAHDDQLVEQIKTLFDGMVVKPPDGEPWYQGG